MKHNKATIAALGLAAAIAAYFLFRKKANAGELAGAGVVPGPSDPVVSVPEITLTSEVVADAATVALPGRTSQSTIEASNSAIVFDPQAAIADWISRSSQSAARLVSAVSPTDAAAAKVAAFTPTELQAALTRGVTTAAAPVATLSQDTADQKKRREAYRGVIKAAADLLTKSGVSGSGCGILDAGRALALDPFGVSIERMAGVVDTIEQKVSQPISVERKDATYRSIAAMTDPIAICFALTVQLSKAATDVASANAQVTANPTTTASLIGRRIATALKVSCQGATSPTAATSSGVVTFDAGKIATSTSSLSPSPTLKTGYL
jgi:hypothetical protein